MSEEIVEIPSRLEYFGRRLRPILEEPVRTHILVGATALVVGVGIGYALGKKNRYKATVEIQSDIHEDPNQLTFEFDSDELAQELAETRAILEDIKKKTAARAAARELEEALDILEPEEENERSVTQFVEDKLQEKLNKALNGGGVFMIDDEPSVISDTIFAEDDDDWNQEVEELQRSKTEPYILHKDEFYADEMGYEQTTLTYYEGDNIMADQDDSPVYNYEKTTGPLKFGHGSGDPNVVYIRNDRLKAEYEVIRDSGLFSVEVLGLEIPNNERVRDRPRDRDLRHSDYRKFRDSD